MRYLIGYNILPGRNIPSNCFIISETPPPMSQVSFTCGLYSAENDPLKTLMATTETISSAPIPIGGLPGSHLALHLNYADSHEPDTVIPLDLSERGGLASLNQMMITVIWYEKPGTA